MTNKKLEDIFMSYLEKIPEDLKLGEEREATCVCGENHLWRVNK